MRQTNTNSGTDSRGVAFGLEGNLYIPVVVSVIVSIVLLSLMMGDGPWKWAVIPSPIVLTLGYVLVFVHQRPARFQNDYFNQWIFGPAFNSRPNRRRLKHPLSPEL